MKRPAKPGEKKLTHATTNTVHEQSVAIVAENFDPAVLKKMHGMKSGLVMNGFGLSIMTSDAERVDFYVTDEQGSPLSLNTALAERNGIGLVTTLMHNEAFLHLNIEQAGMLADLEQCAAILLLDPTLQYALPESVKEARAGLIPESDWEP